MVRSRLASLALAASLGLAGGCANLCERPLMGRLFHHHDNAATVESAAPCCEGPILGDAGTFVVSPGNGAGPGGFQPLTPQPMPPQLAPTPRISPIPQSQPFPAPPQ